MQQDTQQDTVRDDILSYIDDRKLVDLLSELIRIPSVKNGGETPLAEWLADYFTERGYEVDLQEVEPGRFQTIATLRGDGSGRSLMLNGHIDMDPLRDGWTRDPWTPVVEGDLVYGAGAYNMKGGDASIIVAAEAVRQSQVPLKGDLIVACVLGELQGGLGTKHLLDQGIRADMAIVAEPVGAHSMVTMHAGVLELGISLVGFSQHILAKRDAVDAIKMAIKAVDALDHVEFRCVKRPDLPDLPIVSVGGIIGGLGRAHDLRGPNFVSDFCTLVVDVRFLPGQTVESVLEDIEESLRRVSKDDPDFVWEITREPSEQLPINPLVFDPTDVPVDEEIVKTVVRHYREVAQREPDVIGAKHPFSYGGNDTAHLWKAGIPCVLYGPEPPPRTPEMPDDCMSISEMVLASKVIALTALDICG